MFWYPLYCFTKAASDRAAGQKVDHNSQGSVKMDAPSQPGQRASAALLRVTSLRAVNGKHNIDDLMRCSTLHNLIPKFACSEAPLLCSQKAKQE